MLTDYRQLELYEKEQKKLEKLSAVKVYQILEFGSWMRCFKFCESKGDLLYHEVWKDKITGDEIYLAPDPFVGITRYYNSLDEALNFCRENGAKSSEPNDDWSKDESIWIGPSCEGSDGGVSYFITLNKSVINKRVEEN